MGRIKIDVYNLPAEQPRVNAGDWCHPLVCRMLDGEDYHDGPRDLVDSFRPSDGKARPGKVTLTWAAVAEEIEKYQRTYQDPQITERAALAVACVLVRRRAKLLMLEATKLGDSADYWIGTKPGEKRLLLEVSGQQDGSLEHLTRLKSEQLRQNRFEADGYVCVVNFADRSARLWFFKFE